MANVGNNPASIGRLILAIESSCDDTSAAVLRGPVVLSNIVAGQQVHARYGGVVPELASRAHQENIVPVVHAALSGAGVSIHAIEAIAFTQGPGLMGSLLVGASFAKALALSLSVPMVAVDHMQAHILAHLIHDPDRTPPQFPFLCLTVSGGHTQLVLVHSALRFELLGQTLDDAAGEAFDKAAKMLGLGYPGGPLIDRYAKDGDPTRFTFARPQVPGLDMSFSGMKSSLLQLIQKETGTDAQFIEKHLPHLCASFQRAVVGYLIRKTEAAMVQTHAMHLAVAGGVSANSLLRSELGRVAEQHGWTAHIPRFEYCTDNAAMIGMAGQLLLDAGQRADQRTVPMPRMPW